MSPTPAPLPAAPPAQVLLVEDSAFFTRIVTKGIESRHGLKVVCAGTMAEAKEQIERHRSNFFLALLDLTLPDAPDGEIVDYVESKGIPAVIFSSRMEDDLRERVFSKSNVVDYVLKDSPASLHYIVNMVGRLYRNRGRPALVVDDSAVSRLNIAHLLTLQQFDVRSAPNAKEALRLIEETPDLRMVITDFHMPGMDGAALAAAIREKHPSDEMAVIGVSSTGTQQISALFIKSGANDFLPKPFLPEEFFCRVSQNIELIDKIQELKAAAHTDFLTSLYNRRFFFEAGRIAFARAQRQGSPIAVAMIDIDFFKKINDTFGHDAGDSVLVHLGGILRARARRADIVARVGGEEFCILFEDADPARLPDVLEALRAAIAESSAELDGHRLAATVSIGACATLEDTLDKMVSRADEMLYRAKQSGRNRIVIDETGAAATNP